MSRTTSSTAYTDTLAYGPGPRSAHRIGDGDTFDSIAVTGLASPIAYASMLIRYSYPPHALAGYSNWKLLRFTGPGGLYTTDPRIAWTYEHASTWNRFSFDRCEGGEAGDEGLTLLWEGGQPDLSTETWFRAEISGTLSAPPDSATGRVGLRVSSQLVHESSGLVTRNATCPDGVYDGILLPFGNANDGGWTWEYWVDDMYFDDTLARVELCDTSTFLTASHCEIQVPRLWSDGEVQVTVNRGAFAVGAEAYLVVIDERGIPSVGYRVTLQ